MDWDKLKIFHAVAEAGNFTKATYILNLSQSAISRQIQSLEQELKTQLFERHARGLSLTENGEYLFKTAHEVISKLKDGDCWCICADTYAQSINAGTACKILLKRTNYKTLKIIPLKELKKYAIDLS